MNSLLGCKEEEIMRRRRGFKEVERKLQGDFRFEKSALGQQAQTIKLSDYNESDYDKILEVSNEDRCF